MKSQGIRFKFTMIYISEQNRVSEQLNRTLITIIRTLLLGYKLPLKFWANTAETVSYIRNRIPVRPEGKTPEEAYSGKKPSIAYLRSWDYLVITKVPVKHRDYKFQPPGKQVIFIGYKATSQ